MPRDTKSTDPSLPVGPDSLTAMVRQALPKSTLNAKTIPDKQARRIARLPGYAKAFHSSWLSLDDGRRSCACCYEWARLQLFMATYALPAMQNTSLDFFHVTLVDKRWRTAPAEAGASIFDRPRRKVRAAIQHLHDTGYEPVFVAAYELSGDRNLSGTYNFEPHAHLLIGGVPRNAIAIAFEVRQPLAARGGHKPTKIASVPYPELGSLLGYLTKMKAQDRVEYLGSNGRSNRASNRMPRAEGDHWLRCMASMPMTQAIQFGGFADFITNRFIRLEMATLMGEI